MASVAQHKDIIMKTAQITKVQLGRCHLAKSEELASRKKHIKMLTL